VKTTRVLIVYDSRTGNTEKMAHAVEEGVKMAGAEAVLRKVDEASVDELLSVQGLILGSPVYYGLPSAKIKGFLDESVKYHGRLVGLAGGTFCSAGGTHTGSETTVMALNEALLVHGMVIQGSSSGNHYGATSVGAPDEAALDACRRLGEKVAKLAEKLHK
jgi:NAD(P)H dehydrogenase (quinone)